MHEGDHDWLINSGEMIIYAFLLVFFSPYNQKYATSRSRSRSCDYKYKQLPHNMHYKAQTSKVQ